MTTTKSYPHLWDVRTYLWALQKELLHNLKSEFDHRLGKETSPSEWFQALTTSIEYSWVQDLTKLMAEIDVCIELDEVFTDDEAVIRLAIENLLFNGSAKTFYASYSQSLLKGMNLLPLHNHLKVALGKLPSAQLTDEDLKNQRSQWHSRHREQSKTKRN